MAPSHDSGLFNVDDFYLGPSNINNSASSESSSVNGDVSGPSTPSNLSIDDSEISNHPTIDPSEPSGTTESWVALGSIRLIRSQDGQWLIFNSSRGECYPNQTLDKAERRGWLKLEQLNDIEQPDRSIIRIYVLPEDVNRSVRSSITDMRRTVKWLLAFIDTSSQIWNGGFDFSSVPQLYGVPSADRDESLFYIFNTLDSPNPQPDTFSASAHADHSMNEIIYDNIPGLTTEVYPYQKRSIATMLQREEDPAKSADHRKPQYLDLHQQPFYMDVFDGIMTRDPHLYVEPRGGILAETMGYGKTLACLALILSTRGHYPQVPEGRIESSHTSIPPRTSSLLSMAARSLVQAGVPWKADFHALKQEGYHYDHITSEIRKYNHEFAEPIFHPTTPDRKASRREADRILRLCYATLVIVPPNLVSQWQAEITKHIEPGALDVLVLGRLDDSIPPWRELMNYDVVLIARNRLEKEYRDNDLNEGKRYIHEAKYRSALTEVRWLRVICDEGHDFAGSSSSNAMAMLSKISVERRWIISGTPSGVHGVEVNLAAGEAHDSPRKASLSKALEDRRLPDSAKQEIKDMDKLRMIVTHFLHMSPWANQKGEDHASWKKYLAPFDSLGKRRCAPGLRLLLQSLMVRHRIEELDVDVPLPNLHNRTVYLEPSYYDKLSLNLFMLDLTVNAVTSERVDEDYMFHPRNRKALDLLVSNLRQSTFHWAGFSAESIFETMRVGNKYFDDNLEVISDLDACLLTEGLMNGERALDDGGWRALATLHEIGVYVESFPGSAEARQAWSLHGDASKPLLMGTTQARAVKTFVLSNLHQPDPMEGLMGAGLRVMNESRKKVEEQQKSKKEKAAKGAEPAETKKSTPAGVVEDITLSRSSRASTRLMNAPRKRSRSNSAPESPSAGVINTLKNTKVVGFTSSKLTYLCSQLLKHSPTSKSIVFYDSSSPNIAYWLAEALELLSIPHHIYASGLKQELRSKYLREFNTEDKYRVLVMDLKQASLGLHIAVANRVYIVSPIWSPSVEAQAIKRAHRIGQNKEVYVETLVLKGTIEERLWKRRKGMSEKEQRSEGKGGWLDDQDVCAIIKSEGFLRFDEESEEIPRSTVDGQNESMKTRVKENAKVCRLDVPQELFSQRSTLFTGARLNTATKITTASTNSDGGHRDQDKPKKKQRVVRFADEMDVDAGPSTPSPLHTSALPIIPLSRS